jgi:hypothetical protein
MPHGGGFSTSPRRTGCRRRAAATMRPSRTAAWWPPPAAGLSLGSRAGKRRPASAPRMGSTPPRAARRRRIGPAARPRKIPPTFGSPTGSRVRPRAQGATPTRVGSARRRERSSAPRPPSERHPHRDRWRIRSWPRTSRPPRRRLQVRAPRRAAPADAWPRRRRRRPEAKAARMATVSKALPPGRPAPASRAFLRAPERADRLWNPDWYRRPNGRSPRCP